jgi:hypothetical protein
MQKSLGSMITTSRWPLFRSIYYKERKLHRCEMFVDGILEDILNLLTFLTQKTNYIISLFSRANKRLVVKVRY